MNPLEIVQLALSLSALVVSIVIGLTGAFKKALPNVEPLFFSIPVGMLITVLAWFATQPVPVDVSGWAIFALVLIIGGLLPSGLFDAGVNFARKVQAEAPLADVTTCCCDKSATLTAGDDPYGLDCCK